MRAIGVGFLFSTIDGSGAFPAISGALKPGLPGAELEQTTMDLDSLYANLTLETNAKLALIVLDGLGDIATREQSFLTPLEAARTPNLDALSKESAQGRMIPVAPGITPGSGPGHLGLFGYDPLEFEVGRGVIEALGLGLELKGGDVAARANFCTLDAKGIVTDRRAGRIDTPVCEELCALLASKIKKIGDTQVIIKAGKGHRFVVVFRGKGLEGPLTDSDPHREGLAIPASKPVDAKSAGAKKAAKLIGEFYKLALPLLAKKQPANGFLMRGIAHQPEIPTFEERYKLKPACIAVYPMYKGLAQLVGMTKIEGPQTIQEQFEAYRANYDKYNFFFVHYKYTDMHGEDGNFEAKKKAIEEFDAALPILLEKRPDVIAITGDHSTPCAVRGHSWHPQPVLLNAALSGSDKLDRFTETGANIGSLGVFQAKYLIRLMQANARMFDKFGA
ncbi:MAG TPA: 2,3-bisphosphoglycerate-independent phosphoglycerate mutase [Methylomirabilota bacterium]|nr:2,3-bisphosphoglycerate-independent phosphoglycerate mutase [Methylomirabilota bacterium]